MSPNTLSTVINARLGDAAMKDSSIIIKYLKDLCNAKTNQSTTGYTSFVIYPENASSNSAVVTSAKRSDCSAASSTE